MCASINHWQDRRKRWWTGNTRLDKQNNEFQQPGPATHTLWPPFKHALIMSPCLQLCKHILTLSSTLCCDWNLAQSQCWKKNKKNGRDRCCNRRWSSLAAGGEARKRWMRNQELLKRSLHGRGKTGIKSLWTEGQKTDYSLFGGRRGGGLGGQDFFVCYNSQSVYKWNADRKFYSSLTVEQELHPSPDAGIRSPLPLPIWGGDACVCFPFAAIQLPDELKTSTDTGGKLQRRLTLVAARCPSPLDHWSQHVALKFRRGPRA